MLQVLTMPGITDCPAGMITRWYKQPGDRVQRGEPLVEIIFSSAAQVKQRLTRSTDQHDSLAHLVDQTLTLIPIRTESHLNISATTIVGRSMHMVVAVDIEGVIRAIIATPGQPIQPGAIIAQLEDETS